SRGDRVARSPIARVEASLKADLDEDPASTDILEHVVERRQVECDGLLAERGNAGRRGQTQQWRMTGSRGRDHDGIDPGVEEGLGRLRRLDPKLARNVERASRVGVREDEWGHALERRESLYVKGAHPANTDHSDV